MHGIALSLIYIYICSLFRQQSETMVKRKMNLFWSHGGDILSNTSYWNFPANGRVCTIIDKTFL